MLQFCASRRQRGALSSLNRHVLFARRQLRVLVHMAQHHAQAILRELGRHGFRALCVREGRSMVEGSRDSGCSDSNPYRVTRKYVAVWMADNACQHGGSWVQVELGAVLCCYDVRAVGGPTW